MDGFICRAIIQNPLFFSPPPPTHSRVRWNPAWGLACHNKAGHRSSAEAHYEVLPESLSMQRSTSSPLQPKVKSKSLVLLSFTPAQHCWPQWRTTRKFSPQMNFTPIYRHQADLQVDYSSHKIHRKALRATEILMIIHFHGKRVLIPIHSSSPCIFVHFPLFNLRHESLPL